MSGGKKKLSRDGSVHVTDEQINTQTAIVGTMLSVVGATTLIIRSLDEGWLTTLAVAIYSLTLVNMFAMSALHHAIDKPGRVNTVFRKLDYTAIYALIAGTVTPLVLIRFRTAIGFGMLAATWALAAAGISLYASLRSLGKHITNSMFIALGWIPALVILTAPDRLELDEYSLLIFGGVVYSVGFFFYSTERPNPLPGKFGFHELWHLCVIAASAAHFFLVFNLV